MSNNKLLLTLYKPVLHGYFAVRNSWPVWDGICNRRARNVQLADALPLTAEDLSIVEEIRENGIATTRLETLLEGDPLLQDILEWHRGRSPVENTAGRKSFLREYWSILPTLDFTNPFLRFAVHSTPLSIVNAYMGMWSRLSQFDLRKTLPQGEAITAIQSQKWHRDPEEKRMLKIFLYLNDVDAEAGPFTYIRKSTFGNKYGHLFPQRPPEGNYPPEEAVQKAIQKEDIKSMTASAGTVIFCDTSGLHFGGRATKKERIMSTIVYNSPAYTEGARYRFSDTTLQELDTLTPQARFALSGKQLKSKTGSMSM